MKRIGQQAIKSLYTPAPKSKKGDNGILLIIGGSKKFHGAPLLSASIASKIVDLVYFSSVPENNELIKKIKERLSEFITVERKEVLEFVKKADCILLGPGLGASSATKRLTNDLLRKFPTNKFVLDADSIKVLNKKLLGPNCVVTPHSSEFKTLFKVMASEQNVKMMSREYNCTILLKGAKDIVCSNGSCKYNTQGNQGLTKGGTGDVLAGLISALACKNDLYLSAQAGIYLNGLAADNLKKKVSYYYKASDLVEEIPKVLGKIKR